MSMQASFPTGRPEWPFGVFANENATVGVVVAAAAAAVAGAVVSKSTAWIACVPDTTVSERTTRIVTTRIP